MPDKNTLKKIACAEIDRRSDELIELGKEIWRNPELGYQEFNTSRLVQEKFASGNLPYKKNLAVTGVRADLNMKKPGPRIAVLGELDALYTPDHAECNPQTGAAHACAHNAQITALVGCAFGLNLPEITGNLSGAAAFIATPAEEGRLASLESGKRFVSGKTEMIFDGVFDDIDLALMIHGAEKYGIAVSANGLMMKNVRFIGKACHAGRPWAGANALSAARLALTAIDSQRELFKEADTVRIHGIIKNGGAVVNTVPHTAELEYMVRAQTPEAMTQAAELFDRCMRAAAIAFDLDVEIETHHGCMPLLNDPAIGAIHRENLFAEVPDAEYEDLGIRTSSTDFGDVTMIIPGLHPYSSGWHGAFHTFELRCDDEYKAYVEPAKLLAMDVIDLLYDDAAPAKKIAAKKTRYTKAEYCKLVESFDKKEYFSPKRKEKL
ncbi:MAG: amidohydrolase [Lentisphaeria bacterium]|nr:amidohydrolase [Lentisphaeria bacterium]